MKRWKVHGAHRTELLFTPAIDRDIHAVFLEQIADSDPSALHVVIQDQAGCHLPSNDPRPPQNLRLLPLPPTARNSTRWSVSAGSSRPGDQPALPELTPVGRPPLRRLAGMNPAGQSRRPYPRPARRSGKLWRANIKSIN